jgi:shikimate dehydrogenase
MNKSSLYLLTNKIKIKNCKYALIIGSNPSFGAKSPKLWNNVYKFQKSKIKMYPADVEEKNLSKLINILKNDSLFIGGSVTVPYKEKVIKYLDDVDEMSKKIGAINTILKKKKKLLGINTDYLGFTKSLSKMNLKKKDKILVLGCGGAGKAVITSIISNYKNNKKYFFNRSHIKLKKFLKNFKNKNINIVKSYKNLECLKNIKLIINTTSIGFDTWFEKNKKFYNLKYFSPLSNISNFKNVSIKDDKIFVKNNIQLIKLNILKSYEFFKNNPNCGVIDIIHTPKETVLMQLSGGIKFNGIEMNLDQAVYAFKEVNKFKTFEKIKKIMKTQ